MYRRSYTDILTTRLGETVPNTSTCKYACAHTRIAVQRDKPALVLGIRNTHGDEKASPQTHTTQIKHIAHTVTTHSRHGAEKICLFPLSFLFLPNRCRARACTSPFVHSCKKHTVKGTPRSTSSSQFSEIADCTSFWQCTSACTFSLDSYFFNFLLGF